MGSRLSRDNGLRLNFNLQFRQHQSGDADQGGGRAVRPEDLHGLIRSLEIPDAEKQRLLALTPASYTGMAAALARRA